MCLCSLYRIPKGCARRVSEFYCYFYLSFVFDPVVSLIAVAVVAVSFVFLLVISAYSEKNAVVAAKADEDMTGRYWSMPEGIERTDKGKNADYYCPQACND